MFRKTLALSSLVSLLLIAPLFAVQFLLNQLLDIPFAPFGFFNWIVPLIPGPVITFGIDLMIDTMLMLKINVADSAKAAEQGMAITLNLVLGMGVGIFSLLMNRRSGWLRIGGALLPSAYALLMVFVSYPSIRLGLDQVGVLAGLVLPFGLWVWGLAYFGKLIPRLVSGPKAESLPPADPESLEGAVQQLNRRQFLITLGAAAATITVVGTGLGVFLANDEKRRIQAASTGSEIEKNLPNLGDLVTPAPGTRSEYTPIVDHYKVFLELEPSFIEAEGYLLPISGMVDNLLNLSLDDIQNNYESFDQFVTLSCISGRVGTTLIGTTRWSGVPLQDILADLGVQAGAQYLDITSADGFHEIVPLDMIRADRRIMLCHSWDGKPLPNDHGFPLRIWIPDRFGMKQPKWIVGMEVTDQNREGYWVERGWDETAQVRTTSVIDTVAVDAVLLEAGERRIPVGGIAWAGDRQISAVEVRVDGGDWEPAQLRTPLSETTWVIWRYNWAFTPGKHTFEVRAYEGDGTLQLLESEPARPSGSTGIDSLEAEI